MDAYFTALYERNYGRLYRIGHVILGYDSAMESMIEDQIQETFMRAWQKRDILKRHPNPDGWVIECFRKCLLNACKKRNREWKHFAKNPDTDHQMKEHIGTDGLTPEDFVKAKEQIDTLIRLLGKEDAGLFIRYCVDGEKAAVLASELQISEQALRMRIFRLKRKVLSNRSMFICLVFLCSFALWKGGKW